MFRGPSPSSVEGAVRVGFWRGGSRSEWTSPPSSSDHCDHPVDTHGAADLVTARGLDEIFGGTRKNVRGRLDVVTDMARRSELRIYEEILLLALRDEEGTIAPGTQYHFALGGAVLAELLLLQRITVEEGRRQLVSVADTRPTGDPLLDESLERIAHAKRRAAVRHWVSRIANQKGLRHRIAEGLCRRGILRNEIDKVLWIFSRRIYPELDPAPERALIARLEEAIFTDDEVVDPRSVVLISLARATGLLRATFGKKRLKERKDRIERIVNGEVTGKATREAVQAMQAAILVSVIIPSVVTTTATS